MNLRKDHSHNEFSIPPATHHTVQPVLSLGIFPTHRCCNLIVMFTMLFISCIDECLARGSLKDAANCAKHLELQISEKEKDSERILRVDLVLTHVIGGDRNMQSLELRSLSGVHMLSQIVAPTCSWNSTRLSFSSSIMISYHDVRTQRRFLCLGFQTFFRTLTTSHGITR